jgi:type IV secretory pathway component VirB8
LETNLELSGYHKTNITINEIEIPAYVYKDDSNFAVIYGENTQNGDIGFYLYDKKNNSVTKYNDEYILDLENKNKLYFYLLIAFSVILLIFVIVLIKLLNKKNKHNKKEIKENNQDKENEIVEI